MNVSTHLYMNTNKINIISKIKHKNVQDFEQNQTQSYKTMKIHNMYINKSKNIKF